MNAKPGTKAARPAWTKSIRFQITFWYLSALALILLVGGILVYAGARTVLLRETDVALAAKATQIASQLKSAVEPAETGESDDRPNPRAIVTTSGQSTITLPGVTADVLYLRLVGVDNRRTIAISQNLQLQPRLIGALADLPLYARPGFAWAGPDEETRMRCLTVPVAGAPYLLQVATPWDHTEDLLTELLMGIAVSFLLFLLLSGIGSWLLVGRTLQPIDRIVSEAERLSADHMTPILLNPHNVSDNEVGHLVAALNGMMSRLYATFEAQRQFTADASHELRTPLTIMRGELELALARERPPLEYRAALESGLEETMRMAHIVENLSVLARGDADGIRRNVDNSAQVSVGALVNEVATALERRAREKNLRLVVQQSDPAAVVHGDADALRRVIRNLLENAVMYTPSGGQIMVSTTSLPRECRVIVSDTGVGISQEDRSHIFDRFYRADKARVNNGGSGLGLSIARSIVEAHDGHIEVESAPGRGSRFTIILPADESELICL